MCQGISQLTTFVDGTRSFRSYMAGDSSRERELLTQFLQSIHIFSDIWIYLAVGTFQISIGNKEVSAVSRTGN